MESSICAQRKEKKKVTKLSWLWIHVLIEVAALQPRWFIVHTNVDTGGAPTLHLCIHVQEPPI